MKRLSCSVIVLIISLLHTIAQVAVEAEIDSVQLFIGEQAHVTVRASMPEGAKAEFPVYKQSEFIIPGVEVLESKEMGVKGLDCGPARAPLRHLSADERAAIAQELAAVLSL